MDRLIPLWFHALGRARQCGQGLAEYALILMLISVVAIVIMAVTGARINTFYEQGSNALVAP